jgi:FkbM family methyltransferase
VEFARRQMRRAGLDVIRYPSARLRGGQTSLVIDTMGIDVVLDVGGNIGQYGEFLRSLGYRGRIVSFEPVTQNAEQLERIAEGDGAWTVVRTALGAANSEAPINVTRATVMSSLRRPAEPTGLGEDIDVVYSEIVPIRRLDSIFDEYVRADEQVFLKMSVQGWDLDVLAGAAGCLHRVNAVQSIVSIVPLYEGMADWLASLTTLRELGFVPTGFFPLLHQGTVHVAEFEAVLVRPLEMCGVHEESRANRGRRRAMNATVALPRTTEKADLGPHPDFAFVTEASTGPQPWNVAARTRRYFSRAMRNFGAALGVASGTECLVNAWSAIL